MRTCVLSSDTGVSPHHADELLGYFLRAVRDPHEAQDLVQETYTRLLGRRGGEPVGNPRALLYEVARNLLIDRHRQGRVRQHESDSALAEHPAPPSTQPETVVAGRQRLQQLVAVIESLPPRCREAFVLHRIDGLPQAEVARRMGVSRNMVERHVMLAMATCRRAMTPVPTPSVNPGPEKPPIDAANPAPAGPPPPAGSGGRAIT